MAGFFKGNERGIALSHVLNVNGGPRLERFFSCFIYLCEAIATNLCIFFITKADGKCKSSDLKRYNSEGKKQPAFKVGTLFKVARLG